MIRQQVVFMTLAMLVSAVAAAGDAPAKIVGTKIISLRGAQSYFLDGDSHPKYTGKNALPLLLKAGWQIVSVHLATGVLPTGKQVVAYVVLGQVSSQAVKQTPTKTQSP